MAASESNFETFHRQQVSWLEGRARGLPSRMMPARLLDFATGSAAVLMLLAPALWNGFPLLEHDTGGYLARWFESTLEISRSTVYGFFLVAANFADFWPALVVQAALTVWVVALVLRAHGLGGRPLVLLIVMASLSGATTLPWLTSILLPDIFAGIGVLALYLLVLRIDALTGWEQAALIALTAFSAATHNATLAVLMVLLATVPVASWICRRPRPLAGLGRGVSALAAAPLILLIANYAVAGQLAWTPGGVALSFGRMLQDGMVARFLADHCPDRRLKLCQHRNRLPAEADVFFWGESVFDRLGRFEGLDEEMRTIVIGCLREYPVWQIGAAARAAARQLLKFQTGEGVLDRVWHTYNMVARFTPSMVPTMRAARQQKGQLDFRNINRLHVPVGFISMMLLVATLWLLRKRPVLADLGALATTAALAILGNAAICGVLSNPHDRYGARMVWISTLVVLLICLRARFAHLEHGSDVVLEGMRKVGVHPHSAFTRGSPSSAPLD